MPRSALSALVRGSIPAGHTKENEEQCRFGHDCITVLVEYTYTKAMRERNPEELKEPYQAEIVITRMRGDIAALRNAIAEIDVSLRSFDLKIDEERIEKDCAEKIQKINRKLQDLALDIKENLEDASQREEYTEEQRQLLKETIELRAQAAKFGENIEKLGNAKDDYLQMRDMAVKNLHDLEMLIEKYRVAMRMMAREFPSS